MDATRQMDFDRAPEHSSEMLAAELDLVIIELRAQRELLGHRMDEALAKQTTELIIWNFFFCLGVVAAGLAARLF